MDQSNAKKLFELAKTKRTPHETEMSASYAYTQPNKNKFYAQTLTPPDRTKIFDSTAISLVQDLAASVSRLMWPINKKWIQIAARANAKEAVLPPDILRMLAMSNRKIYEALEEGNFYLAADEALVDAIIGGNGCLGIYEDDSGIYFHAVPFHQVYWISDSKGTINTIFVKSKMLGQEFIQKYGDKSIPSELKLRAEQDPALEIELVECQYPCEEGFKYEMCVCNYNGGSGWHTVYSYEVETQYELPYTGFRWNKISGEDYGDSPIRAALPTIKTLNDLTKDILKFSEFAAFGAWFSTGEPYNSKGIKGKVAPGEIFFVSEEVKPLIFPGNIQVATKMVEDLRYQLREMTLTNELPPADDPNYMTATEVQARQQAFIKKMGQPVLRIQRDLLEVIARKIVIRLQKRGEIPTIPNDKELFTVLVNSAASMGMKIAETYEEMQLFQTAIQTVGPDTAMKVINMDEFGRKIFTDSGFSPELVRTAKEVKELTENEQQMQQMGQAINAYSEIARATPKG